MEQLFRNQKLNVSIRTVKSGEEVLFYAKDVAESLGYLGNRISSRLPIAEDFQDWVFKEVLPSIRKTGSYKLPESKPLYCNQMRLINETDLHYAVVEYLKKYHPKALILPGLGEYQDTSQKRCDAWKKGYLGGQPDLTIVTPSNGFNGFAIELKTPKGTGEVKDNQVAWIRELGKNGYRTLISNNYTEIVLDIEEYFRVDNIKKLLKEIKNLKIKCKTLKASQCKEVVIQRIGYTVDETKLNLRYLTSRMEDKPEQIQVPVTSEKKKDPKRVAAGKRLAAISKIAKERKKKLAEPNESRSNDSMITYIGVAIALISLVLAYKTHQRETKKPEPKYIPKTVEMSKESKMTTEVYDAVLLTAGAVGISMASKKILKEPLGAVAGGLFNAFAFAGAGYLFKMFDKNGYAEEAHRHNKAMENLTAEREKYLEEVTDRRNRIAQLKSELAEASRDIKSTNQSLELARRINELTHKPMPRKPQLSNHYKPSSEIEEYMTIFGLITGGVVGGAAYLIL
ncbi:VRR-NUC domain-containing [Paramuricea clavata]|uniref:VRR-NUC domain-containing n=1 Tax=Paramuricea clavata TaxID=317549 RepID=A0A6S7GDI6_PARCT|nr:VRR-NUC domain-containing [Paramuricea clavata]